MSSAGSERILDHFSGSCRLAEAKTWIYRVFCYAGLSSIFLCQFVGFRYGPEAPTSNFAINLCLYGLFIVPHLLMARDWFKQAVWRAAAGSPSERRSYVLVAIITWLFVNAVQRPLPGGSLDNAFVWQAIGITGCAYALFLLAKGMRLQMLDQLLAVPGVATGFGHQADTPLETEGMYAEVRHPVYRATVLFSLSTLLIHPNLAQLFWSLIITMSAVGSIPFEEAQLLQARGDEYRRYQERTPYRLFRGVW